MAFFRTSSKFLKFHSTGNAAIFNDRTTYLQNKIAIVTGGAQGIGGQITRLLLENKICGIVIADNNLNDGSYTVSKLAELYGRERVLCYEVDVSEPQEIGDVFKKTLENFNKVDIVINNAGIMNDIDWPLQLDINLRSTVLGTLLGLQYMSKTSQGKGGVIINVASIMGIIPSISFPIHTMSQFGIVGFTRAIGAEPHYERTGVRIVGVCPGFTETSLLFNVQKKSINKKFAEQFSKELDSKAILSPEVVAEGMIDVIRRGASGSIWTIDHSHRPHEMHFPEEQFAMRKHII